MDNPLGEKTVYRNTYDPTLLFPIDRTVGRQKAGIPPEATVGYDLWTCHEFGWLDPRGKPQVRRLRLVYPAGSRAIVESKSLKLYFVSFSMTRFPSEADVLKTVKADLTTVLGTPWLEVGFLDWNFATQTTPIDPSHLIDGLEVECDTYDVDHRLLKVVETEAPVDRTHVSNLLKTNCPITGQPDWATVRVDYRGRRTVDEGSLLRYVVSYREHGDYHELCCEQIFRDLRAVLAPDRLSVKCFFTRRGGIDISPCRFSGQDPDQDYQARYWRQ